jgi:hypothetical protein
VTLARKRKPDPPAAGLCEQGGDPIEPFAPLRVRAKDRINFLLLMCKAPMRARVYLDTKLIAEQTGVDQMALVLPPLAPGFHVLYWNVVVPPTTSWQTRAELTVAGAVRFRRRRKSSDGNPTGTGWVDLDVVA